MDSRGAISREEFAAFAKRHGAQRAAMKLDTLGKSQQFMNAYESPVGKELLAEINSELSRLSNAILLNDDAKPEDRALFKAYLLIGDSWAAKVKKYADTVMDIKDAANG